jgi:hypothetical protein
MLEEGSQMMGVLSGLFLVGRRSGLFVRREDDVEK